MRARRIALAIVLAAAVFAVLPSVAFANFAIHGNYVADTDACAGCHRAHTSVSTITWQDTTVAGENHSALLVTAATEMWQFCYACHDDSNQGSDTNVQGGIYTGTLYGDNGSTLNGGGFDSVNFDPNTGVPNAATSTHMYKGSSWGAYGGGYFGTGKTFSASYNDAGQGTIGMGPTDVYMNGTGNAIKMDCATCHDPHGSPNYRILKTVVNGNAVGEYTPTADPTDPDPEGFVASVEPGWPVNGFRLHNAGNYDLTYKPNYTTAMYAKGYDMSSATLANGATGVNVEKGMSGWCAGCHNTYLGPVTTFTKTNAVGIVTPYRSLASTYNAGSPNDLALRHKHPINVELATYNGPDKSSMIVTDQVLPLAHDISEQGAVGTVPTNESSDWIECLTCHRAHGTAAKMEGYASHAGAATVIDPIPGPGQGLPSNLFISQDPVPSSLLRQDNRGVCESCHNK